MRREIHPIESEKQAEETREKVGGGHRGEGESWRLAGLRRCDRARQDTLLHKGSVEQRGRLVVVAERR